MVFWEVFTKIAMGFGMVMVPLSIGVLLLEWLGDMKASFEKKKKK